MLIISKVKMKSYSCPSCFHFYFDKSVEMFTVDITISQDDFEKYVSNIKCLSSNLKKVEDYTLKLERRRDGSYHKIITIMLPKGCYSSEYQVFYKLSSTLHRTVNMDLFMHYTKEKKTLNLAGIGLNNKTFIIYSSNVFLNLFFDDKCKQRIVNHIIFSESISSCDLKLC